MYHFAGDPDVIGTQTVEVDAGCNPTTALVVEPAAARGIYLHVASCK
jgi:hypothetical protein